MRTIGDAFGRTNNFDHLRIFAALLVLFSHSFPLSGTGFEPVLFLTNGYDYGGGLGVAIFFVISGFLVTKSAMEHSLPVYFTSRLLRIVPGLAVLTVLEVFVLGLMLTGLSVNKYFHHPQTLAHLLNPLTFAYETSLHLPGVFKGLPNPNVNGSLWTLPLEAGFYIITALLAVIGVFRSRSVLPLVAVVLVGYAAVSLYGLDWSKPGPLVWGSIRVFPALRYGSFFLMGSALWVHRSSVPLDGRIAGCCIALLIIAAGSVMAHSVYVVCLPYLVLYAALAHPLRFDLGHRIGDLSYGAYLYAFPIQQAIVWRFGGNIDPWLLTLLAVPIVLLFAFASWRIVERPALRLRKRLRLQTGVYPAGQGVG